MEKKSGFTLIEIVITVFLVSVGLVGVLAFFSSSLTSQFDAKNEVIAAGLAQEATELVRNIVDYNYLNGASGGWYDNLCKKNCKTDKADNKCKAIDYTSLSDHKCENKVSICFDGSRYYECPNSGNANETDFKRDIDIAGENVNGISEVLNGIDLDAGDCLNVVATVTWSDRTTKSTDIVCKPRQ